MPGSDLVEAADLPGERIAVVLDGYDSILVNKAGETIPSWAAF